MSKTLMVCFALLTLLAVGQGFYGASLRQRLRLTEQLAAQQAQEVAQQAEAAKAHMAALEAALSQRGTQISALQNLAQGCEQSRVQSAADAEARQAILGTAGGAAKTAPEQNPINKALQTSTPQNYHEDTTHDSTRAAVANRLNRPL